MNSMWIILDKIIFKTTVTLSKLVFISIKLMGLGSGYTWPGHIALKLYPNILTNYKNTFKKGIVLISGTNGKTTTSKLMTHIMSKQGYKVLHNKSGANLLNGLASAMVLGTPLLGRNPYDVAIFEVDEFSLPSALSNLDPAALVLLNLSRDQLDRYGEIDIIVDKWIHGLRTVSSDMALILDVTQPVLEPISKHFSGRTFYFDNDRSTLHHSKLLGDFNAKNVNAAVLASTLLGVSKDACLAAISDFEAAYGRGELVEYKGISFRIFLAKNPASFNNNLELLKSGSLSGDAILFLLNDLIPDGRDVSWIYDVNPLDLAVSCQGKKIFVSGTRALDMAIRLDYAGTKLPAENVQCDLSETLLQLENSGVKDVVVLPNYSAMLELRGLLTGRKIL